MIAACAIGTALLVTACGGDDEADGGNTAPTAGSSGGSATPSSGPDGTATGGTEAPGSTAASGEEASSDLADLSQNPDCLALQEEYPDYVGKTFNVATAVGTPGLAMVDESTGEYEGANPDLVRALTSCLGGDAELTSVAFEGIVPAIGAGRFDFAAASMYDTPERREVVTYIDYISVSVSGVVPPGNPDGIVDWEDACGLNTGAATGSQEHAFLEEHSQDCVDAGLPEIGVEIYPDANAVYQAMIAGRLDFAYNGGSSIAGFLSEYPDYERVFEPVPGKVEGFQFAKDETEMIEAFFEATKIMQESGTQQAIIDRWGLTNDTLLHEAEIGADPATPIQNG